MNVIAEEQWRIPAHCGVRAEFDENTLSALQRSNDTGVRGFETGVPMFRDLVIMHDDSIERTTRGTRAIEDRTEAELRPVMTWKGNSALFLDQLVAFPSDKPGIHVEFGMKTDVRRYRQE